MTNQTQYDNAIASFLSSKSGVKSFWRHEDTKIGYCLGFFNVEMAHIAAERLVQSFSEMKWDWKVDFLTDRNEILKSLEDYLW